MDQNLGNPLAFQESFSGDGLLGEGNSSADDGNDASGTGNALFDNEMLFNSDKLLYVNFSDDLLSSLRLFPGLTQVPGDMCLVQQQQQLQQHSEQQVYYQAPLTDTSVLAFPFEHTFAQQQQSQEYDARYLSMPQFSTLQHIPESRQTHQATTTPDSQQQLQQHQTSTLPSQPQQYYDSTILNAFHLQLPSSSSLLDVSSATSMATTATTTAGVSHHQQHPQLYNNVPLNQNSSTQRIPIDFTIFRSPTFGHLSLSSPDEGSMSPTSERGYFDMPEKLSSFSPFFPPFSSTYLSHRGAEYLTGSLRDFSISPGGVLFDGAPCSPASSASSASSSVTVTPYTTTMFSPTSSPTATSLTTAPRAIKIPSSASGRAVRKTTSQQQLTAPGHNSHRQDSSLSSSSTSTGDTVGSNSPTLSITSTSLSFGSSVPALSSPLKQQFNRAAFSDDGDSDVLNEEETKRNPKRRKRIRKAAPKPVNKPKGPPITLYCQYPGCQVTCSSHPSMVRHAEAHKWRGRYSPVRCEACQSSLSNEFSVQRHILRSSETSRCRKMRVYSIMKSETEIENTVKFFPTRPHGKKTVTVDLERMKAKYIVGWQGRMD
ncbi:hypothetical protein BG015_002028 [Linnemannia schmuckeri]|uniref:Uncharacterized protein n=1 Tax=Linnemannia schmuckeri TaxID=64567 RepID=A0A9P5RPH9_9FUNG|nr:hypothetical protein BG015_002028 [Linnemannia schmuckeri]